MNDRAPNDYALGHNHEELQRLIGQSRFLGELTEEVLRAAGIRRACACSTSAAAPATCRSSPRRWSGASGSVVGVDRSAEAIALAKRRAADVGLANVSFVTQDLQDLATEARFDAIIGRLVLMYFPEPDAMLRRLLQLLVPGGIVAFHEFDLHAATSEPHVPLLARSVARVSETLRCAHAQPRMGLRLAQTFAQAQLPAPRMIAHARIGTAADPATLPSARRNHAHAAAGDGEEWNRIGRGSRCRHAGRSACSAPCRQRTQQSSRRYLSAPGRTNRRCREMPLGAGDSASMAIWPRRVLCARARAPAGCARAHSR